MWLFSLFFVFLLFSVDGGGGGCPVSSCNSKSDFLRLSSWPQGREMESSAYSCFPNPISAISGFRKAVQKNLEEKKQAAINPPRVDSLRWYRGQL